MNDLGSGTIYTETVVYSPPEAYVNDVPYQLAIVELAAGRRVTGRVIAIPKASERISGIACSSPSSATTFLIFEKHNHETS